MKKTVRNIVYQETHNPLVYMGVIYALSEEKLYNQITGFAGSSIIALCGALRVHKKDIMNICQDKHITSTYLCQKYGGHKDLTFNDLWRKFDSEFVVVAACRMPKGIVEYNRRKCGEIPVRSVIDVKTDLLHGSKITVGLCGERRVRHSYPIFTFDYFEDSKRVPNPYTLGCVATSHASKRTEHIDRKRTIACGDNSYVATKAFLEESS